MSQRIILTFVSPIDTRVSEPPCFDRASAEVLLGICDFELKQYIDTNILSGSHYMSALNKAAYIN